MLVYCHQIMPNKSVGVEWLLKHKGMCTWAGILLNQYRYSTKLTALVGTTKVSCSMTPKQATVRAEVWVPLLLFLWLACIQAGHACILSSDHAK
jgi:hypothetical protein